jgi:hypothetical protein
VQDDTTFADFIVFEKDAVTFFGGLTPAAFLKDKLAQAKAMKALTEVIDMGIIIDATIRSYTPQIPERPLPQEDATNAFLSEEVRRQMQFDRDRECKRFRVYNTTLPGLEK